MALRFDPIAEAGRNWTERGWPGTDTMLLTTSLTRAHQIVQARIDAALRPLGLNFSRFEVLALLSFTRAGALPMGKIGARLQVHPASVTNTIDRLERAGLVERVPHPDDGRTMLARLLPAGRQAATDGADALAAIDFGLAGFDPDRAAEMVDALEDFRRANGDFSATDDT